MDKPVGDLAQKRFWCVAPGDPVDAVAEEMLARHNTWAPVVEGDSLVGVVSAWDLLQLRACGHPGDTPVWRACTLQPLTVGPGTAADEAARLMREAHVHHLVVVSAQGRVLGVLSTLDLLADHGD